MAAKTKIPAIVFLVFMVIVIGSSLAGWWFIRHLFTPVDAASNETKIFVITKGQSFTSVAKDLTEEGLIWSPLSLKLASYRSGNGKDIQAGSFRLSPAMTPGEILETLSHGKLDMWVKLTEGWRREEMAESLAKAFAENNSPFDKTKFLAVTQKKEGYLFPDTYLFPLNTSEETVASILESTREKKLTDTFKANLKQSGRTLHEILTMASLIEREARTDESRRIVAGILWKRIDNGWPLQVDATLQYAKGYDRIEQTWWKPPLAADKSIDSPYNTYKHPGLPPEPICAPSLSSIEAAAAPAATSYWYYLTGNDGEMHYASTTEQHNQNIANYLH